MPSLGWQKKQKWNPSEKTKGPDESALKVFLQNSRKKKVKKNSKKKYPI